MKQKKNRIVMAIAFVVTLLLGVGALAVAWRLQQPEQITEEEAAAYFQNEDGYMGTSNIALSNVTTGNLVVSYTWETKNWDTGTNLSIQEKWGAYWCKESNQNPCAPDFAEPNKSDGTVTFESRTWSPPSINTLQNYVMVSLNANYSDIPAEYKTADGVLACGRLQIDNGLSKYSTDGGATWTNAPSGSILGGTVIDLGDDCDTPPPGGGGDPYCGDGKKDPGEDCDNSACPFDHIGLTCTSDCTCPTPERPGDTTGTVKCTDSSGTWYIQGAGLEYRAWGPNNSYDNPNTTKTATSNAEGKFSYETACGAVQDLRITGIIGSTMINSSTGETQTIDSALAALMYPSLKTGTQNGQNGTNDPANCYYTATLCPNGSTQPFCCENWGTERSEGGYGDACHSKSIGDSQYPDSYSNCWASIINGTCQGYVLPFTYTVCSVPETPAACTAITRDTAGTVNLGDAVTYSGTLTDGDPAAIKWYLNGVEQTGETGTRFSFTANDAGAYTVRMSVNGDNVAACSDTFTVAGPSADCTSKTISPTGDIDPGQNVTFTINYTNGPVAGKILVTDVVPVGYNTVATSTTGCTVSGNTVTCSITAAANATGTVVITAKAATNIREVSTAQRTNTATVNIDTDDDGTGDGTNDTCSTGTTVTEANAVCSDKVVSPEGPVNPGDIVTYTIEYTVERGPATVILTETVPDYLTLLDTTENPLPAGCTESNGDLSCTIQETNTGTYVNQLVYYAQVDMDIPLGGTDIENVMTVTESGQTGGEGGGSTCTETLEVDHVPPACLYIAGGPLTLRVSDGAQTLTATGFVGTHSDLEFNWVAEGGTISVSDWHDSSGDVYTTEGGSRRVDDVVTWTPPAEAVEDDDYTITVYVRPAGDTGNGVTADDCATTATITALDVYCIALTPNDPFDIFPFDMTFAADIGGDPTAEFTYELDFGDDSDTHTGSGTVATGSTVELPSIPPTAHTYDSDTPADFAPQLTVRNTETGETSICPTVLGGETQSTWSIDKDSDVETCSVINSTVTYTIDVTNSGEYTADLEEVRDTLDAKVNTSTVTNIRECDSNGQNCTTYNRADVLDGRTITWPGRTFTAGETRRYMYTVTISSAGDYYNVAEAVPSTGAIVRDDETFPTCTGKTSTPSTGVFDSAVYATLLALVLMGAGVYVYKTQSGTLLLASVSRKLENTFDKRKSFESRSIRSARRKAK